jgi:hypothetical protein
MLRTKLTAVCATTIVVGLPQATGTAAATLGISYNDTFMSPLLASRAITGTGF